MIKGKGTAGQDVLFVVSRVCNVIEDEINQEYSARRGIKNIAPCHRSSIQ